MTTTATSTIQILRIRDKWVLADSRSVRAMCSTIEHGTRRRLTIEDITLGHAHMHEIHT